MLAAALFVAGEASDLLGIVLEELAGPAATISLLVGLFVLALDRLTAAYTLREDVA